MLMNKMDMLLFCFSRLHEFDEQVSAVREGMARVVPVPLLSLFTGYELETMVSASSTYKHRLSKCHHEFLLDCMSLVCV